MRQINLAQTDGFRYLGFQPPLTDQELSDLPLPGADFYQFEPTSHEVFPDGTMNIGFSELAFGSGYGEEEFIKYAQQVTKHLGDCALDTEVRQLGPGSVIAQAAGAPAGY